VQNTKHKFGRDVLLSSLATATRVLRHLMIIPVLTHGLDQIQLGLWEQVMVGIALAIPWLTLQLPGALVRFLPGVVGDRRRDIAYSLFLLSLISSSMLCLVLVFFFSFIIEQTRWNALAPMLPLIGALAIITACLDSVRAYFRALRQMLRHSTLSIAQYFGELVLIGYVLLESSDITMGLWTLLAIRAVLMVSGALSVTHQLGWAWPSFAESRIFLRYSIPLIPNSAFYRVFEAGDRYLIAYFLGHAAVGVYYVSYTAASVFATIAAPVHLVLLPTLAELWDNGQKGEIAEYLNAIIRYTTILSLPILVFVVLIPGQLLSILTPEAYGEAARYLPILSLGFLAFSLGVPADHLLLAAGKTRILFVINSAMALANIILNFALIPVIGIAGAALSTLAGHLLYSLAVHILAKRIITYHLPWHSLLLAVFCASLMAVLLHFATGHMPLFLAAGISLLAYFLLCIATRLLGHQEWQYLRRLIGQS
jgi:O-antigen/teichoic acid export membrane protein